MEEPLKKVIYFEDENDMVELVRIILGREGYAVQGVREGQEGKRGNRISGKSASQERIAVDVLSRPVEGHR